MKIQTLLTSFAIIANLFLTGCTSIQAGSQGFKGSNINMTDVTWTPSSFHASTINSSTPINSMWRGGNKLAETIATAGIAIAVPGSGAVPSVIRGAGIVVPHITNPSPSEPASTR